MTAQTPPGFFFKQNKIFSPAGLRWAFHRRNFGLGQTDDYEPVQAEKPEEEIGKYKK